ncbi:hypothetical protein [Streptomyces sp. NPDC051561]
MANPAAEIFVQFGRTAASTGAEVARIAELEQEMKRLRRVRSR